MSLYAPHPPTMENIGHPIPISHDKREVVTIRFKKRAPDGNKWWDPPQHSSLIDLVKCVIHANN